MVRTHPHAEAAYRIFPQSDGTFGIEILVPDTYPANVTPFATEAAANAWIADHKKHVEAAPSILRKGRPLR